MPTAAKRGSKKKSTKKGAAKTKPVTAPTPAPEPELSPVDRYLTDLFTRFRDGDREDMDRTELLLCKKIEEAENHQVVHGEALAKLQEQINKLQTEFATRQNLRDRAQSTATAHIDILKSMFEMEHDNVVPFDQGDEDPDDDAE